MGDWIEHDGKGMPVPRGTPVEVIRRDNSFDSGLAGSRGPWRRDWGWANQRPHRGNIIRYRIRRPRAMETIDRILADVPELEPA